MKTQQEQIWVGLGKVTFLRKDLISPKNRIFSGIFHRELLRLRQDGGMSVRRRSACAYTVKSVDSSIAGAAIPVPPKSEKDFTSAVRSSGENYVITPYLPGYKRTGAQAQSVPAVGRCRFSICQDLCGMGTMLGVMVSGAVFVRMGPPVRHPSLSSGRKSTDGYEFDNPNHTGVAVTQPRTGKKHPLQRF